MRIAARIAVALLLISASGHPSAAQPIEAGELLVSYGDELWRIDPDTGARSRFSPPPLALVNRIGADGADQIAVDPEGAIFLVSDGLVVEIDPVSGEQSILRARTRVCNLLSCTYVSSDLDVGTSARGIDVNDDPGYSNLGDRLDLYVGGVEGIYRVVRAAGEVSSQLAYSDSQNYFQLRGPLVATSSFGAVYAASGTLDRDLHPTFGPPTPIIAPALGAPGAVSALDSQGGAVAIATQGCDPSGAGVYFAAQDFLPVTQGGFLRCPVGLAIDPLRLDRIWVTDRGTSVAPANRIFRLDYDGLDWRQTLFAELPGDRDVHAITVSPVSFAPEPGALGAGVAALGALLCAARTSARPR